MARKKKEVTEQKPDDLFVTIKGWVDDCISNTQTWASNQEKWHKMRMRIKKTKNFPFVGCSNLRMPTLETKLRKLKSSLINTIFGIRPIVQAIPTPSGNWQTALKVEKFLDHLIMEKSNLKPKAIIAVDKEIEKGFYLLKPHWKYEETTRIETLSLEDISMDELEWLHDVNRTKDEIVQAVIEYTDADMSQDVQKENLQEIERITKEIMAGATNIKFILKDVICNYPDVDLCEPERVYVSTDSGFDPQGCQTITHEFYLPLDTVKKNGKIKGWSVDKINDINGKKDVNLQEKTIDITKDQREGIERIQSSAELVKIWETYCWYDINNDGEKEKCVITTAPDFSVVLRKATLPYFSGKFPFVKLFYELTDDRWFSHRGIPEIIEDIVKEIDIQHMQKIDQQTIRNSPMFLYRAGMVNNKVTQFIFGQGLPVNGMQPLDDLMKPLNANNPNVEFSYEREEMLLGSKIEELIGQMDFTLQSMINKRQPRTLGEVNLQYQNQQMVFSLDADMLRMQMEEVFNWYWELWCKYGDDDYEFSYFGKEGWEKIRLSREEVQGKYKICVRGNDQNTNSQLRIQKAQMIIQASENPVALQTGVITPMNLANAYKRFYQELDIPNWEELVTIPQPQPQQAPPPPVKMGMEDLTPAEQAQVKAKFGIQPDIQGQMLAKSEELKDKEFEKQMAVADLMSSVGGEGVGGEEKLGG